MYKIISEAKYIPEGNIVTKIRGKNRFLLSKIVKIYGPNPKDIIAEDGTLFLLPESVNKNINVISSSTELIWEATLDDLCHIEALAEMEREDK